MSTYRVLARTADSLRIEWRLPAKYERDIVTPRILRAGVCGTDLQILRRVRLDSATVLGHEGVGELTREQALRLKTVPGRFVIFNPVDLHNQDRILGHSYDGIFGESAPVPVASIVSADPRLPADLGPLVEPLATVIYAWQLLTLNEDPATVGIWGGGTTAVLTALVAQRHGARVHIFHRRPERLSWLARIKLLPEVVFHRFPPFATDSLPRLDAGIVCVPRQGSAMAIQQTLQLVREDGCIDLFGGFAPGDSCPLLPGLDLGLLRRGNVSGRIELGLVRSSRAWGSDVWLTGHRGTSTAQLAQSQRMLIEQPALFGSVISHVISLEHGAEFIPGLIEDRRPAEHLKVIIDPTMQDPMRPPDLTFTLAQAAGQG